MAEAKGYNDSGSYHNEANSTILDATLLKALAYDSPMMRIQGLFQIFEEDIRRLRPYRNMT
jgi:hypothetical protein